MTERPGKVAYTVDEAADATSLSVSTVRRALRSTDPSAFPPPLRAKRAGTKQLIEADELRRWVASFPDA